MIARLFLIALPLTMTGSAWSIGVQLYPTARPTGPIVRLGDVARLTDCSPEEEEHLAGLPLGPSPTPGVAQHLSAGVLRELLGAQGVALDRRDLTGAERVAITTRPFASEQPPGDWAPRATDAQEAQRRFAPVERGAGYTLPRATGNTGIAPRKRRSRQSLSVNEVDRLTTEAIEASLTDSDLMVAEVRLSARATDYLAEAGGDGLDAAPEQDKPVGAGLHKFQLTTGAGNRFSVVARLETVRYRVVAAESLARGSLVTASSVRLEPIRDKNGPQHGEAYDSIESALGRETVRAVRAGTPISAENTASPLLVRRGETVSVVSGGKGIRIRLTAISQGEGRKGDLVSVETPGGEQRFDARVIGSRQLAILGAGAGSALLNNGGTTR